MRKFKYKILYGFLLVFLYESSSFGASEATKQLINKTLAKYGIGAGGKEDCNTDKEPFYDKNTGIVRCYNNNGYKENNCWDKDSRLCKECPSGTVVSKNDYINCRQLKCPYGYELIEVKDGQECPEGFEKKPISLNSCDSNFYSYTEQDATKNYTTQSINCKNVN